MVCAIDDSGGFDSVKIIGDCALAVILAAEAFSEALSLGTALLPRALNPLCAPIALSLYRLTSKPRVRRSAF